MPVIFPIESSRPFNLITNYIYFYPRKEFVLLPVTPDSVQDSMGASFSVSTPLSRSAPIYSYSHSGPRSVQISMTVHRDLMQSTNYQVSNVALDLNDDYVDTMIKYLQSMVVPRYAASTKMVDPPQIALRIGNEIYCKGIINGNVGLTYRLPLLENDKYAIVDISFTVTEVEPYDADQIIQQGSFRGLNTTLERNFWINGKIPDGRYTG